MNHKLKIEKVKGKDGKNDDSKRLVTCGEIKFTMRMRGRGWQVRHQVDGKKHQLNLRTADPKRAAKTAIDKIRAITKEQWDVVHAGQTTRGHHTIEEVCKLYASRKVPKTQLVSTNSNITALKKIVRVALGLNPPPPPKYKVNADKSRTTIEQPQEADKVSTTKLTVDLVKEFQHKMIHGLQGIAGQDARRAANSALIAGRAVFEKHLVVDGLYPNLPDISRFKDVGLLEFVPLTFDFEEIDPWCKKIFTNLPALRKSDPSAYLFVLLAAKCGLRRGEIAEARNSWIVGEKGKRVVHVQPTETWIPKGRKKRKVPLDEETYHDILALTDAEEWIVPADSDYARQEGICKRVSKWMISLGWPFKKKIHELRKWYGSQVADQTRDLLTAQRMLGHADPKTTEQYYADIIKRPKFTITLDTGGIEPEEPEQKLAVNN